MNKLRNTVFIIAITSSLLSIYLIYNQYFKSNSPNTGTIVNNSMVVEKIEALGKLELCKFYIKDIIEQKEIKEWYLPNSKIILIISGEVTGCLDLTLLDSSKIQITKDLIRIKLPNPEICYTKINHQESKVYDIQNEFFNKAELIDKAYALAEKNIEKEARRLKILEQTKANGIRLLKPLLETGIDRKVELYY